MSQADFSGLSRTEQNAVLEEWCVNVEVDAKFKKNPLFKVMYELLEKLKVHRWSCSMVEHPELVGVADPEQRAEIIRSLKVVGSRGSVELPSGSIFSATVWVPDFQTPGYNPYSFIDDLAVYVALKRAQRKRSRH